jgi:hypothetical protein
MVFQRASKGLLRAPDAERAGLPAIGTDNADRR